MPWRMLPSCTRARSLRATLPSYGLLGFSCHTPPTVEQRETSPRQGQSRQAPALAVAFSGSVLMVFFEPAHPNCRPTRRRRDLRPRASASRSQMATTRQRSAVSKTLLSSSPSARDRTLPSIWPRRRPTARCLQVSRFVHHHDQQCSRGWQSKSWRNHTSLRRRRPSMS